VVSLCWLLNVNVFSPWSFSCDVCIDFSSLHASQTAERVVGSRCTPIDFMSAVIGWTIWECKLRFDNFVWSSGCILCHPVPNYELLIPFALFMDLGSPEPLHRFCWCFQGSQSCYLLDAKSGPSKSTAIGKAWIHLPQADTCIFQNKGKDKSEPFWSQGQGCQKHRPPLKSRWCHQVRARKLLVLLWF